MNLSHGTPIENRSQEAYTEVKISFNVNEYVSLANNLKLEKLLELQLKIHDLVGKRIDNRNPIAHGNQDEVVIHTSANMLVDMDYLVNRMEFDQYIHKYLVDMDYIVLKKPSYVASYNDFLEGVYKLRDEIQKNHFEDILAGEL